MGKIEEYIKRRIDRNENLLASFVGGTGSGKSFAAIREAIELAKILDPNFSEERIVFSAYDCLKLVYSNTLVAGSVVIYDESGVSTGNMDFQNKDVIMFTKVLQTFRESNYILLFTLPSEGLLVKAARGLMHMRFTMKSKKVSKKKAYRIVIPEFKFDKTYYNGYTVAVPEMKRASNKKEGEFYYVNLQDDEGNYIKYKRFELPPKSVVEPYLRKKLPFLREVQRMALRQYEEHSPYAELTEQQRKVYELSSQGLTQVMIGERLGISQPVVGKVLKAVRKKGYDYTKKRPITSNNKIRLQQVDIK